MEVSSEADGREDEKCYEEFPGGEPPESQNPLHEAGEMERINIQLLAFKSVSVEYLKGGTGGLRGFLELVRSGYDPVSFWDQEQVKAFPHVHRIACTRLRFKPHPFFKSLYTPLRETR